MIGGVVGVAELLNAEEIFVDEALEEVGGGRDGAHFHAATHAVEGHRDDGVAGLPTDGAVLGVVGYLPDAGLGEDGGLVVVEVIGRRKGVNGGVLVERKYHHSSNQE